MAVRKRSVSIAGHATSFSLEDEFWQALHALAMQRGCSIAALVVAIDAERAPDANLSSAIRTYLFAIARNGQLGFDTGCVSKDTDGL